MNIFELSLLLKGFDIGQAEKKLKHVQSLSLIDFANGKINKMGNCQISF